METGTQEQSEPEECGFLELRQLGASGSCGAGERPGGVFLL